MPRPRRIDLQNTYYHVLSRGNERRLIFEDKADHERFLINLGKVPDRFDVEILSYVLMGNHYHLLVRTEEANLSQAMQWLGTSYTAYLNRRRGRTGHLFQGRFKSFVVEDGRT